jgi:hypothetical protein
VLLPLEILLKKNALLWILNLFWDDLQTVSHVIIYLPNHKELAVPAPQENPNVLYSGVSEESILLFFKAMVCVQKFNKYLLYCVFICFLRSTATYLHNV